MYAGSDTSRLQAVLVFGRQPGKWRQKATGNRSTGFPDSRLDINSLCVSETIGAF